MVLVHGIYRWRPVRVAFRNDYCRRCQQGTLSVRIRTFDVLHLFWVPVLPLGVWSRWHCARCGYDPRATGRTRRGFKIAVVLLLAAFNVAVWLTPQGTASDLEVWLWRGALLVLLALAVRWVAAHKPEPNARANLALMPPYEGWDCPLCGAQLLRVSTSARCPSCKAEHQPLMQAGT